jgi:RNA-splicing ligase RtcB
MQAKVKEIKETCAGKDIPSKIKEARKELGIDFDFNVHGMEFLEGQDAIDYFMDMIFAQKYADFNRKRMLENICKALSLEKIDEISCIHNFINFDDMVIRKGAISSYEGDRMIIPFSMSDGLLICEGKSNSEWNNSAPHGAGRLMSRGEASRNIDLKDFERKMKGIVSTSVCKSTLDEAPQAYKNPKVIEKAIEPTAKILDRVKPILNLKDKGESMTWKERKEKIKKEKSEQRNRKEMRRMKNKW